MLAQAVSVDEPWGGFVPPQAAIVVVGHQLA